MVPGRASILHRTPALLREVLPRNRHRRRARPRHGEQRRTEERRPIRPRRPRRHLRSTVRPSTRAREGERPANLNGRATIQGRRRRGQHLAAPPCSSGHRRQQAARVGQGRSGRGGAYEMTKRKMTRAVGTAVGGGAKGVKVEKEKVERIQPAKPLILPEMDVGHT